MVKSAKQRFYNDAHIILYECLLKQAYTENQFTKKRTQKGEFSSVMSSTRTLDELPMVRGTGRANVVDEPPAVPLSWLEHR